MSMHLLRVMSISYYHEILHDEPIQRIVVQNLTPCISFRFGEEKIEIDIKHFIKYLTTPFIPRMGFVEYDLTYLIPTISNVWTDMNSFSLFNLIVFCFNNNKDVINLTPW